MKKLIVGFAGILAALAVQAEPLSLSINFAGARNNTTIYGEVGGSELFGAYPITGDRWNNVKDNYNNSNLGNLVWSDGLVRAGVTITTAAGCWWTTGKTQGIFYSYLDDNTSLPTFSIQGLTVENGFPTTPCTVYIYFSTDSSLAFHSPNVNGVRYCGSTGGTIANSANWGSNVYSHNGYLYEGGNYLRIANVTPATGGSINIASGRTNNQTRGGIAAVQIVFEKPAVEASCASDEGTVAIDSGTAATSVQKECDYGTTLTATLTATPADGYEFRYWKCDKDVIVSGTALDATIGVSADSAKKLEAVFGPVDDRALILSVNFAGGKAADTLTQPISGPQPRGVYPVAGDNWNNISNCVQEGRSGLVWNNGGVVPGVSMSHGSAWSYITATPASEGTVFYSYLDDVAFTGYQGPFVEFDGLTAANGFPATCTVVVYMSTDNANVQFPAPKVNGVQYSHNYVGTVTGSGNWGSSNFACNGVEREGGDFLVIPNVAIQDGKVNISALKTTGSRGCIAGIQLAFDLPKAVTVTATSFDVAQGTVQFGDETAGENVTFNGSDRVITTLRAIPAPGYAFVKWGGMTGVIAEGAITDAEVTVDATLNASLTAEFVADSVAATATWIGEGDRANVNDPLNWDCRTVSGTRLEGVLPTADTTITISGTTSLNVPAGQSLVYKELEIGNVELAADCDWRGFGAALVIKGTVDVKGHKLYVAGLNGPGTITDTACLRAEPSILSVNFSGTRSSTGDTPEPRGTVSGETTFGGTPVAGKYWNNISAKNSTNRGGLIWNDGTTATGLTLTASNTGVMYTSGTAGAEGTLFYSYLDDASATAKISGLTPANGIVSAKCTVYVYMSGDAANKKFKAVTVNGVNYCANGNSADGSAIYVGNGSDWGDAGYSLDGKTVPNGNYIRIPDVMISAAGEVSITPLKTTDTKVARGGFAAFQIADLVRSTSEGTTGELHVDVPAGTTIENTTVTLAGGLKLVKDGAGTFVPAKAGQDYAGGTEVVTGGITLGTSNEPLGVGNGRRTVTVDAGALFDFNGFMSTTQSRYSFVLDGGTVNLVRPTRADGWNTALASIGGITLLADSSLVGRFFFFGHNTDATPLTFNGHTLTLDIDDYVYAYALKAQDAGTILVNGGWVEFNGTLNDLTRADVLFRNDAYTHISATTPVGGFAYERNYWGKHTVATQINVAGRYWVGANRPPLTLLSGVTLDFTGWPVGQAWDPAGLASPKNSTNDNHFEQPGLVTFTANGNYTVDVGDKVYPRERTKLVTWTAIPTGATFELAPESKKKNVLKVEADGLYIINVGGLVVIIR
ncbi:MAG: hypothetical protein MJ249_01865 [Kiritimatiellae bacterium]|nr:hypothetical protein [Kiritimatiellia bacterium]